VEEKTMKCEVCKDTVLTNDGQHFFYLFEVNYYDLRFDNYRVGQYDTDDDAVHDVMVCTHCKYNQTYNVPKYISSKQYSKWLIRKLKI
jgi:hypothetical protein